MSGKERVILVVESEEIVATTRKLDVEWTYEITPVQAGRGLKVGDTFAVPHFAGGDIQYVVTRLQGREGEADNGDSIAFLCREEGSDMWNVSSIWTKSAVNSLEKHLKWQNSLLGLTCYKVKQFWGKVCGRKK